MQADAGYDRSTFFRFFSNTYAETTEYMRMREGAARFDFNTAPVGIDVPGYFATTSFTAKTTVKEKAFRVLQGITVAVAVASLCISGSGYPLTLFRVARLLTVRKGLSVLLGHIAYPATLRSRARDPVYLLTLSGYTAKRFPLYKSGVKYDALLIYRPDNVRGRWALNALGNMMTIETCGLECARQNDELGYNTLVINGPGVGNSGGLPVPYSMGAGFEAGLQYLEQIVGADHIRMEGFSLGGAMLGEAVSQHDFSLGIERNTRYMMVSDRTFGHLADAARAIVSNIFGNAIGLFVKLIFCFTGSDLEGVSGARKLARLGITHVIIQHEGEEPATDGIITDEAGLARALSGEEAPNRVFCLDPGIGHHFGLPRIVEWRVNQLTAAFSAVR